jgi:hypothetical protein
MFFMRKMAQIILLISVALVWPAPAQINSVTRPTIQRATPSFPLFTTVPVNVATGNVVYVRVSVAPDPAELLRKTVESQKKRAAEGSAGAQYDLGLRYLAGEGVEKNPELGRKWLDLSAAQGNTGAIRKIEELKKVETTTKGQ